MTVADEIKDIDEQMQKSGHATPIKQRRTRLIKLTYHGIVLAKKNRHIISSHGAVIPDRKARENENDIINQLAVGLKHQGITDAFTLDQASRMIKARKNNAEYSVQFNIFAGNEIRRDLDNQASTLLDAMTKAGAIPDDSIKFLKTIIINHKGIDRIDPRAEIIIRVEEDAN